MAYYKPIRIIWIKNNGKDDIAVGQASIGRNVQPKRLVGLPVLIALI
jgi:hypothetical protein